MKKQNKKNPLSLLVCFVLILALFSCSESAFLFGATGEVDNAYAESDNSGKILKKVMRIIDASTSGKNADEKTKDSDKTKPGKVSTLAGNGPAPGRYLIVPYNSDTRPITVQGASKLSGASLCIYQCDMAKSQLFDVTYDSEGRMRIKNTGSKKFVSISGLKAKNGARIVQSKSSKSTKQRWIPEAAGKKNGQPVFRLRSALNSKYCMRLKGGEDRDMASIYLHKFSKASATKFVFIKTNTTITPADKPALANGVYKIGSALSSSLSFAIPNSSLNDGVQPVLQKRNSSFSQLFIFNYSKGYYSIKPLLSGKSLSVLNGNILARARLGQNDGAGKSYQKFKITKDSSGNYRINAKSGGLALRIASGDAAAGRPLETWYTSADASQAFTLTRIASIPIDNGLYTISPFANSGIRLSIDKESLAVGASASVATTGRNFAQKFNITSYIKNEVKYYTLQNVGSGLVLDASSGSVVQNKLKTDSKGIPVDSQLWSSDLSFGGVRFISKSTGKAIQLNGSANNYSIKLESLSNSTQQGFIPSETEFFDSGQYRIENKAGGAFEVTDGSFFKLAKLQTSIASESGAQAWYIKMNSNGSITLKNERSGKPAEVASSSAGATVRQNTSSGKKAQKWFYTSSGDGWYALRTAAGSTYLDAGGAVAANGKKNVRMSSTSSAGAAIPDMQKWRFVPITVTKPGPPMPKAAADAIEKEARTHLGKPYVFGASGPDTFDCSGFVYYVLNKSGVREVARVTAQDIYEQCIKISPNDAKRGDIIFFTKTYDAGRPVTHLGFYLGKGKMIHAGDPVQISSVKSKYFKKHFYAYGRIS